MLSIMYPIYIASYTVENDYVLPQCGVDACETRVVLITFHILKNINSSFC